MKNTFISALYLLSVAASYSLHVTLSHPFVLSWDSFHAKCHDSSFYFCHVLFDEACDLKQDQS